MSSLNKRTKQIQPLYAEERRKRDRLDQEKQLRADVEQELIQYFQEQDLEQKEHLESFYPAIYEFIKRKAPSLAWKKYAHEFFRSYIKKINSVHDKFHRTLILSGFCLLKIAKISLNSSFFPKPIQR